jgi:hypothetical protein
MFIYDSTIYPTLCFILTIYSGFYYDKKKLIIKQLNIIYNYIISNARTITITFYSYCTYYYIILSMYRVYINTRRVSIVSIVNRSIINQGPV